VTWQLSLAYLLVQWPLHELLLGGKAGQLTALMISQARQVSAAPSLNAGLAPGSRSSEHSHVQGSTGTCWASHDTWQAVCGTYSQQLSRPQAAVVAKTQACCGPVTWWQHHVHARACLNGATCRGSNRHGILITATMATDPSRPGFSLLACPISITVLWAL
jgi:hypothetical protein